MLTICASVCLPLCLFICLSLYLIFSRFVCFSVFIYFPRLAVCVCYSVYLILFLYFRFFVPFCFSLSLYASVWFRSFYVILGCNKVIHEMNQHCPYLFHLLVIFWRIHTLPFYLVKIDVMMPFSEIRPRKRKNLTLDNSKTIFNYSFKIEN